MSGVNEDIDKKINIIKHEFNKMKDATEDIEGMFDSLSGKIVKLKEMYNEFLDANKNDLFVFGLDSFNFQNKIIDVESGHMKSFCNLIFNRIYCDYYRVHTLIKNYIQKNIKDEKLIMKANLTKPGFPKYDYLNIYKPYTFDIITELFNDIVNFVQLLNEHSKKLELDLNGYKVKGKIGLNINNFVHTYEYKNVMLREEINLYLNYMNFFMALHTKYLGRFITKLKIMHGQIAHDIKFDDNMFSYRSDPGGYIEENSNINFNDDTSILKEIQNGLNEERNKNNGLFKTKSKLNIIQEVEEIQNIVQNDANVIVQNDVDVSDDDDKNVVETAIENDTKRETQEKPEKQETSDTPHHDISSNEVVDVSGQPIQETPKTEQQLKQEEMNKKILEFKKKRREEKANKQS